MGKPNNMQLVMCTLDISPFSIAKPDPNVNNGPNAKKIDNSPKPFLETNLSGGAV